MSKKRLILCGIILVLGILIIIAMNLFIPAFDYTCTPEGCINIFGVSIEEFMNTELEFYDETGDFRKNARIDENGQLIVTLSQYQVYAWKKSDWLSDFSKYPEKEPFVISSDYKKLDIYISSNVLPSSQEYEAITDEADKIILRMGTLQLLDGLEHKDIVVLYTVINKDTDQILYQENIDFVP